MSVEDRVKKIVSDQLGTSLEEVNSDSSFVDDLGADSLDTVELVMAFEEEFGCEIPDDAAEKILTVKDAVNYIEQITCLFFNKRCDRGLETSSVFYGEEYSLA